MHTESAGKPVGTLGTRVYMGLAARGRCLQISPSPDPWRADSRKDLPPLRSSVRVAADVWQHTR
jgi:hypothetical protein